jgi:hypothetical protein
MHGTNVKYIPDGLTPPKINILRLDLKNKYNLSKTKKKKEDIYLREVS